MFYGRLLKKRNEMKGLRKSQLMMTPGIIGKMRAKKNTSEKKIMEQV